MNTQRVIFDISMRAILKVVSVLLGLWFLFMVREILLLFFIVIVIVVALAPIVDKWQEYMSRPLAVGLVFVILLAVLSLIVSLVVPPLIDQISQLANNLPQYSSELQDLLARFGGRAADGTTLSQQTVQTISQQLSRISSNVIDTTFRVVGGIFTFFTVVVLSFYLLLEEQGIRKVVMSLLPIDHKVDVANALNKVGAKLGAWLRGQLTLMAIIGTVTGLSVASLGLPYALALGLWAGLTEVIPYIGPIIGGIPVVLIAFLDSPIKAVIALVILGIVQQAESNFIVPKIMQRSVGLSPVIVILALLMGGKLFGIVGTVLAVPVAATVSVVIEEWPKLSRAINRHAMRRDEKVAEAKG
jgi:predicted PurR-regulated permease PerM